MPETEILQARHVMKIPRGAVQNEADIVHNSPAGQRIGDEYVHVKPGTRVDISKWPDDRMQASRIPGGKPEKHVGAGEKAKVSMIERGSLVPLSFEIPQNTAIQRTHRQKNVMTADGSVNTVEIRPEGYEPEKQPKAKAARRAK